MRDEVGNPALAPGVVDQVSFAHSVDAAPEVLQPVQAQVVAARHQKMKLGVMARSKKRTSFLDHPAVQFDDIGPDLDRGGRFRNQVHERRRVLARVERDRPQVNAGNQRIVDQLIERDRLERRHDCHSPAFDRARHELTRP